MRTKFFLVFTKEVYAWMYNAVNMNCSQLSPKSPWAIYCDRVQQVRPHETLIRCAQLIVHMCQQTTTRYNMSKKEQQYTLFDMLTRTNGAALFPCMCCSRLYHLAPSQLTILTT